MKWVAACVWVMGAVACGASPAPSSLDDLRAPEWRLAELQLQKASAAMYRWDRQGRVGCPTIAELRQLAPNLSERDPWGHAVLTLCDSSGFVAVSVGPDGQLGTRDDAISPVVIPRRTPNDIAAAHQALVPMTREPLLHGGGF